MAFENTHVGSRFEVEDAHAAVISPYCNQIARKPAGTFSIEADTLRTRIDGAVDTLWEILRKWVNELKVHDKP
jgi:hypothetical protein